MLGLENQNAGMLLRWCYSGLELFVVRFLLLVFGLNWERVWMGGECVEYGLVGRFCKLCSCDRSIVWRIDIVNVLF